MDVVIRELENDLANKLAIRNQLRNQLKDLDRRESENNGAIMYLRDKIDKIERGQLDRILVAENRVMQAQTAKEEKQSEEQKAEKKRFEKKKEEEILKLEEAKKHPGPYAMVRNSSFDDFSSDDSTDISSDDSTDTSSDDSTDMLMGIENMVMGPEDDEEPQKEKKLQPSETQE